jgi:UDP-N-acetylglucosamine diphosphorylase / glucose-1-phosphate thymidylyltransferase / UDP-N-acetylgalactosamine diphosphorylase / glucosamine-1-phosphate N-acetyltransferase / galactosamine-1-phosphate N-acetyltransferase
MPLLAVVLAAGEGLRMRPLTERWPKPVLPIDGRAVIATLLHELAAAGIGQATIVTGYLAEQVEALVGGGGAFGVETRFVRQPRPDGGADAVRRAELEAPFLVTAADTVYAPGTIDRLVSSYAGSDAAGAMSFRRQPGRPAATGIRVQGGNVVRAQDSTVADGRTAAPLSIVGAPVASRLDEVCSPPYRPPYELTDAFQRAIDEGERIVAVEVEPTRDLTDPLDLVRENFPYLAGQ